MSKCDEYRCSRDGHCTLHSLGLPRRNTFAHHAAPAHDPPDMTEPVPSHLAQALDGRYRLIRELGAGGMATVYLAEDVRHERRVAIKVLREELSASLGADRFLREIRIAANLQHPHVLPLFDSGDANGALYYVMPFVEGNTLRDRLLRERELPIGDAMRILHDVTDAMSAAHAKGIVHRDLKPENVMLSGRHALVADFGVAKAVSESTGRVTLTTVGVALGTPTYMAPEQATADPLTDHRADIYALGVMAYEMLTGEPPFVRATPQAMLAAHVIDRATPVTEKRTAIPVSLAAIVMQCLEKKPADRPQRADDILAALEAISGTGAMSGGVTPTETRPYAAVAPAAPVSSAAPASIAPSAAPPMPAAGALSSTPPAVQSRRRVMPIAVTLIALLLVGGGAYAMRDRWQTVAVNPRVRTPVAVVPFEVRATDATLKSLGLDVAERVSSTLQQAGYAGVVSARDVQEVAFTEKNVRAAAASTKAATLVFGTVTQRGGDVELEARVVRAADQLTLWVLGPERAPLADAQGAVAAIAKRAAAATGYFLSALTEGYANPGLTTPPSNLEALRLCERASELYFSADNGRALPVLQQVAAADPGWVLPKYLLAASHMNASGKSLIIADSIVASMQHERIHAPVYDAALIDFVGSWRSSPESEIDAARALWRADSLANPYAQMWTAQRTRRPRTATRLFAMRDTSRRYEQSFQAWQTVYASALHALGEYQEELALARDARHREPRTLGHWLSEARALEALGRIDELELLVSEAATLEVAYGRASILFSALLEADYHRRPNAKALAERVLAAYAILPASERESVRGRNSTRAALRVLGRSRDVVAAYEREYPAGDPEGTLLKARYRVLLGDTAGIGAIIDSARTLPIDAYQTWGSIAQPLYFRAQLLAMMGRKDEAVASLREALNHGYRFITDDALQSFWDNVRDYAPFVELTKLR